MVIMPAAYRFETDMRDDVVSWMHIGEGLDVVVDEVEGVQGVPDLIGASADIEILTGRLISDRRPPCRRLEIEVMQLLATPLREDVLKERLQQMGSWEWRYWLSTYLQPLIASGWVCVDVPNASCSEGREWRAAPGFSDPFSSLVAVSLKLSDWSRGRWQAWQCASYVDRSYLALPAEKISPAARRGVAEVGAGLLSVSPGLVEVVHSPRAERTMNHMGRRMVTERMLIALRDRGARRGRPAGSQGGLGRRPWTRVGSKEKPVSGLA
jgi:hypothetical protein